MQNITPLVAYPAISILNGQQNVPEVAGMLHTMVATGAVLPPLLYHLWVLKGGYIFSCMPPLPSSQTYCIFPTSYVVSSNLCLLALVFRDD